MSFHGIDDVLWEFIEPYLPPQKPLTERPITVDKYEYKKKSVVERFFSWIESCKKVFPIYEIRRHHI